MSTSAVYYGAQQASLPSAQANAIWTQGRDIAPGEAVRVLMTMRRSCSGLHDTAFLPAVSYIAKLALHTGMLVEAPRSTWLTGPPSSRIPFTAMCPAKRFSTISARHLITSNPSPMDFRPPVGFGLSLFAPLCRLY